jgi:hypothetical protein
MLEPKKLPAFDLTLITKPRFLRYISSKHPSQMTQTLTQPEEASKKPTKMLGSGRNSPRLARRRLVYRTISAKRPLPNVYNVAAATAGQISKVSLLLSFMDNALRARRCGISNRQQATHSSRWPSTVVEGSWFNGQHAGEGPLNFLSIDEKVSRLCSLCCIEDEGKF